MNKNVTRVFLALSLGLAATAFAEADKKGCADHPLFPTRMPDFFIVDCKTVEFDAYPFKTRNHRLNVQAIHVNRSPVNSTFGYYTGGQHGNTISAAFSVFF